MTRTLRFTSLIGLGLALGACNNGAGGGGNDDDDIGQGEGGGVDASGAPFFLPTGQADNTAAPSIEVDATGRIHAVFPAFAGGRAYYATCAADCAGPSDVQVVRFETDSTVANTMLALDGGGRPRVLLSSFNKVYYASCDADCGDLAAWRQTELFDHNSGREVTGEAFALDPAGVPHFMIHTYVAYLGIGQKTPETHYVSCVGDCHDPAAWTQQKVADQIWESSALRFDAQGRPRLATVAHVVQPDASTVRTAAFVQCDGACDNGDNWLGAPLETAYFNHFDAVTIRPTISLDLTSSGAPRIAVLGQDEAMQRRIVYFGCDANCTEGSSWSGTILSDLPGIGAGLDLALDAADHPRVAYTLDYNIGLLHCDAADCTAGEGWNVAPVELSGQMDPDDIFLEHNCTVAAWFLHSPSVAITQSGAVRVGYQARDISGGFENPDEEKPDCEAGTDMTWSRLALMGAL